MFPLIPLFILVILISFCLAFYSMRIFELKPNLKYEHATFLIRNPEQLNPQLLSSIFADLAKMNLMISLERLFRGNQSALVIYGPKNILLKYKEKLDLLELEEYANVDINNIAVWEVGVKDIKQFKANLPELLEKEQVWVQLILKMGGKDLSLIPTQMRIAVFSENLTRLKELTENVQKSYENILPKIPKPYSKNQLLSFYKSRSFIKESGKNIKLNQEDVLNLGFFF